MWCVQQLAPPLTRFDSRFMVILWLVLVEYCIISPIFTRFWPIWYVIACVVQLVAPILRLRAWSLLLPNRVRILKGVGASSLLLKICVCVHRPPTYLCLLRPGQVRY